MSKDETLKNKAQNSDFNIFMQSIFPKVFGEIAMTCYNENTDAFKSMFEDGNRYNAIMFALGEWFYRDARNKNSQYNVDSNAGILKVAENHKSAYSP